MSTTRALQTSANSGNRAIHESASPVEEWGGACNHQALLYCHHQCGLSTVEAHSIMGEDWAARINLLPSKGFARSVWRSWSLHKWISHVHLWWTHWFQNIDHAAFLTLFWQRLHQQHPWIRLSISPNNATSTNKNKFFFSWAMEMVSADLSTLTISSWDTRF